MEENVLDYFSLIKKNSWVIEKNQNCIISPDSDGFLCGLFMSHFFDWKIKGFYDGRVLAVAADARPRDCVFLDIEIFKEEFKSVGQHLITFKKSARPEIFTRAKIISPNEERGYDFQKNFKQKYPFGTIHFLMAIACTSGVKIALKKEGLIPLFYTDGVFKSFFNYPENCLSWLRFLSSKDNVLKDVFKSDLKVWELSELLSKFFKEIENCKVSGIVVKGRKPAADKLRISDKEGQSANIDKQTGIKGLPLRQLKNFLELLAHKTGWNFKENAWDFKTTKISCFKTDSKKPTLQNYNKIIEAKPLSLAIISGNSIEYTQDKEEEW